jgi:hypothetical protein
MPDRVGETGGEIVPADDQTDCEGLNGELTPAKLSRSDLVQRPFLGSR